MPARLARTACGHAGAMAEPDAPSGPQPLADALRPHVESGRVPGLVAVVAGADGEDVAVLGDQTLGGPPMTRRSLFRIASITKPIVAAAAMALVERGLFELDEPVGRLLPELAAPQVLRSPTGPVDDTVPAVRPITVRHLLTFTAGLGFPPDFSLPFVALLTERLQEGPPDPQGRPDPDTWMERVATMPLLHQPGEGWAYNTGSDLLGVLLARAAGRPLPDVLTETVFEPLGMVDTGFWVPEGERSRLTSLYRRAGGAGGLELVDGPDGAWSSPPAFPSGAGGLVSTVDDWLAFGRMLLNQGEGPGGQRVLSAASVTAMTTNALDDAQREAGGLFLDGQGWGFGGGVDIAPVERWQEPGRYGWVGGTGTTAYVAFASGRVTVLLTQVMMAGPTALPVMEAFWEATAP